MDDVEPVLLCYTLINDMQCRESPHYPVDRLYIHKILLPAAAALGAAAAVTSAAAFSVLFISVQGAERQNHYTDHGCSYNNICKIHIDLHKKYSLSSDEDKVTVLCPYRSAVPQRR